MHQWHVELIIPHSTSVQSLTRQPNLDLVNTFALSKRWRAFPQDNTGSGPGHRTNDSLLCQISSNVKKVRAVTRGCTGKRKHKNSIDIQVKDTFYRCVNRRNIVQIQTNVYLTAVNILDVSITKLLRLMTKLPSTGKRVF